ncbi:MAG: helix-turn-helix domain-containing protein [Clostridia bacterium]|nr:helix-turn-helix domain-containing protein [Clostridia bacterium]
MNYDLNIISIENVFYRDENKWARNICKTRHYDAIVFFTEGEIEYNFPQKTVVAKKGDILLLPGNLPYSGKRNLEYCSYYVIDFLCSDEKQFEHFGAPCSFPVANYQKVLQQFESALRLWNRSPIDTMIGLKGYLYSLLRERFFQKAESDSQPAQNDILQYIEGNLFNPTLSVMKICKELYISDSQLRRTIHKFTGVSPNEYITLQRVNKAKVMLSISDESIKDISCACGFASPFYFSRVFSKVTGMSPSAYRAHTTD